jgi:TolB-like protein/DNA-binding winged helix-turn-helix (wHTH) protein/Flp pilus assembly protein TadD
LKPKPLLETIETGLYYRVQNRPPQGLNVIKFKEFELDRDRYELRRNGRAVKLEKMPMELLILLVAKKGHLVTRLEIIECLWGNEVFIDSEHGINTAVRKLRQALRDDPEKPRFVETVTGKGYRFVMPAIEVEEPTAEEIPKVVRAPNGPSPEPPVVVTGIEEAEPDSIVQAAPLLPTQESSRHRSLVLVAVGSLVALGLMAIVISWIGFDWTERFFNRSAKLQIRSLAVIPLENLSGDPGQEYFADGMTDELITMLAKNSTLRIISRTSVMQYKGIHRPVREIARELGVDGIVEGSVARSGNAVRVTLQLIHAPTDTHMWAESYDRETSAAISLPFDAARTIATRLGQVTNSARAQRYISPQAHDGFIRGLYYEHAGNYDKAIETFKEVVALQPDYALAWNELAFSYGYSSISSRPSELLPKGKAAIRRALELDDSLAEAHNNVAGVACFWDWDWNLALKESARTVELDPNYAFGHFIRSRVLLAQNRLDESLEEMKRAHELDPAADPASMVTPFMAMRRFDSALEVAKPIAETSPDNDLAHIYLGYLYHRLGKSHEAADEMVKAYFGEGDKNAPAARRLASGPDGYNAVLRLAIRIREEQAVHEYVPQTRLADLHGMLGDREGTIHSLENALRDRHPGIVFIQANPWFDFVHSDERYRAIVRQVGLPPAY